MCYVALICKSVCTEARRAMGIAELLTAINGQSSVPVSETELKDGLRMLGSDITINWTARTVQLTDES